MRAPRRTRRPAFAGCVAGTDQREVRAAHTARGGVERDDGPPRARGRRSGGDCRYWLSERHDILRSPAMPGSLAWNVSMLLVDDDSTASLMVGMQLSTQPGG